MNNTIEVTLNGLEGGEEALSSMHGLGEAPLNATDANTMSPSAVAENAPAPPRIHPQKTMIFPSSITSEM